MKVDRFPTHRCQCPWTKGFPSIQQHAEDCRNRPRLIGAEELAQLGRPWQFDTPERPA